MVIGVEKNREDNFFKKIASIIANYIVRKFTNSKAKDHGCSLKVLKKKVYDVSSLRRFSPLCSKHNHGF